MPQPETKPRLLDGVVLGRPDQDGYAVASTSTGENYRIGIKELKLLELADGTRTISEIADQLGEHESAVYDTTDVAYASAQLGQLRLLERPSGNSRVPQPPASGRSIFKVVRPLKDPSAFLERHRWLSMFLGGPIGLAMVFASLAIGLSLFITHSEKFGDTTAAMASLSSAPKYVAAWVIMLFAFALHEVAHAVVATRYGARVKEMGFMLLFFQPCLYTDVSDAWRLPRAARVWIGLAGVLWNLLVVGLLLTAWALVAPEIGAVFMTAAVFVTLSTFVNLNPLLPFDGYFALMDLVGVANLRPNAIMAVTDIFHRRKGDARRVKEKRGFYLVFGTASITYTGGILLLMTYIAISFLGYILGPIAILAMLTAGYISLRRDMVSRGWGRRIPKRPIVRPGALGIRLPGGDRELFRHTGESVLLPHDGGLTEKMLPELDGRSLKNVAKSLGVTKSRLKFLLRPLAWSGFLQVTPSDEAKDSIEERYDRNLVYLSYLNDGDPWQSQADLTQSTVAIVGDAGWCEWAALHLCASGVKQVLVCADESDPRTAGSGPPFDQGWLDQFRPDSPVIRLDAQKLTNHELDLLILACAPQPELLSWISSKQLNGFRISMTEAGVKFVSIQEGRLAASPDSDICTVNDQASSGVAVIEAIRMMLGAEEPTDRTVPVPGG